MKEMNKMGIGNKKGNAAGAVLAQAKNDDGISAFKQAKLRAMQQRRNLLEQESAYILNVSFRLLSVLSPLIRPLPHYQPLGQIHHRRKLQGKIEDLRH